VRALTADREALAMAHATVTAQVNQAFNAHAHFTAEVAFDVVRAIDHFTDFGHFGLRKSMVFLLKSMFASPRIFFANGRPIP